MSQGATNPGQVSSLAQAYASLLLHDAGVAVTAANIQTVLKAAKLTAPAIATATLEAAFKETPVATLVEYSLGGLGGAASAGAPAASAAAPAAAAKKEAPKVEEPKEEEADMDMGDLFG